MLNRQIWTYCIYYKKSGWLCLKVDSRLSKVLILTRSEASVIHIPDILATVVGVGQVISIVPPVLPCHLFPHPSIIF